MISVQCKLRTPQVRAEVSTHGDRSQHFPPCSTVAALGQPETPSGVGDHHLPIFLELVQDATHRKEAGVHI